MEPAAGKGFLMPGWILYKRKDTMPFGTGNIECPKCHFSFYWNPACEIEKSLRYCPHCGERMDEKPTVKEVENESSKV